MENASKMAQSVVPKCTYTQAPCSKKIYLRNLCREHFLLFAKNVMQKAMVELYRNADLAFGLLDPEGLGYLTLDLFLNSYVTGRSKLTPEEITTFFEMQNIFKDGQGKLTYA